MKLKPDDVIEAITYWQDEYESLVRTIGSITYGKERWFYQDNDIWYDRKDGAYINTDQVHTRISKVIQELEEE